MVNDCFKYLFIELCRKWCITKLRHPNLIVVLVRVLVLLILVLLNVMLCRTLATIARSTNIRGPTNRCVRGTCSCRHSARAYGSRQVWVIAHLPWSIYAAELLCQLLAAPPHFLQKNKTWMNESWEPFNHRHGFENRMYIDEDVRVAPLWSHKVARLLRWTGLSTVLPAYTIEVSSYHYNS